MSSDRQIKTLLPHSSARDMKGLSEEDLLALMDKAQIPGMALSIVTAAITLVAGTASALHSRSNSFSK